MFKEYQIYPTNFVKLINWVSIKDGVVTVEEGKEATMLCQAIDGKPFIVRFKQDAKKDVLDLKFVKDFFDKKSKQAIKSDFITSIEKSLRSNDPFMDDIEDYIEKNNLDRKAARGYEDKLIEEKAKELASLDRTMKEGSIIKIPLSTGAKIETAILNGESLEIVDSVSILVDSNNEPTGYGIYYISQNRFQIPLVISASDTDLWNFFINNSIVNKEQINELLMHSIRTVRKTEGFFLYFFKTSKARENSSIIKSEFLTLINDINNSVKSKTINNYISNVEKLSELLKEEELLKSFLETFVIKLPNRLNTDELLNAEGNLFTRMPEAFMNLLFRKYSENLEGNLEEIKNTLEEEIIKSKKMFGFYNIIGTPGMQTSDTYGFLPANLRLKDKLFVNIELYQKIITRVSTSFYEKYGKGGKSLASKGVKNKTYQSSEKTAEEDFDINSVF